MKKFSFLSIAAVSLLLTCCNNSQNQVQPCLAVQEQAVPQSQNPFCDQSMIVHFPYDSSEICPHDLCKIDSIASKISQLNTPYEVWGHCSCEGSDNYNGMLGMRRAKSAINAVKAKQDACNLCKPHGTPRTLGKNPKYDIGNDPKENRYSIFIPNTCSK